MMGNLTVDTIVALYAEYQSLHFWMMAGISCAVIGFIAGLLVLVFTLGEDGTLVIVCRAVGCFLLASGVVGVVIALRCVYLFDVVLKPEIARCFVPAGFDTLGAVGEEVREIWVLLKGLLK